MKWLYSGETKVNFHIFKLLTALELFLYFTAVVSAELLSHEAFGSTVHCQIQRLKQMCHICWYRDKFQV